MNYVSSYRFASKVLASAGEPRAVGTAAARRPLGSRRSLCHPRLRHPVNKEIYVNKK